MDPGLHRLLPLDMLALVPWLYQSETMNPGLHCVLLLYMLALVPSQVPGRKTDVYHLVQLYTPASVPFCSVPV